MDALRRLARSPHLLFAAGFLDDTCVDTLLGLCNDSAALDRAGAVINDGPEGLSAELPVEAHAELIGLAERLTVLLGVENDVGGSFRLRRYGPGQGHPPHIDTYEIAGSELITTVILCLQAPESGGETVFPDAEGGPLAIKHRRGQLVLWHDLLTDGHPDLSSRHFGARVGAGEKVILSWFVYSGTGALDALLDAPMASEEVRASVRRVAADHPTLPGFGRRLAFIDDGVPEETVTLTRYAAEERGLTFEPIDPREFDFAPERSLRTGDLIYRPAVSMHAMHVEQHLWHPGVGSFHLDPDGPLFSNINAPLTFARQGLPVPRTVWLARGDRPLIRRMVEALGGFPVVLKLPGYSRGVGVMRADSFATLFSMVDFVLAEGGRPLLSTYIPDAVHWRIVVVGHDAVASYRNVMDDDDFRTSGSDDAADYSAKPPEGAAELAVRACHALRTAHGGVDILEHPSGRLYLLEANSPCYYPQAQVYAGVDIAGAMMDYLIADARAAEDAAA